MVTIITIADCHDMQPHELADFLDLDHGVDYEKELDEEEAQNIIDLLEYDRRHNH